MTILKLVILSLMVKLSAFKTSTASLVKSYKENKVVGIDVRSLKELKSNPARQAIHIPLDHLEKAVGEKVNKDANIFVFCEAGYRAEKAKQSLTKLGYKNVTNIKDWRTWNKIRVAATK